MKRVLIATSAIFFGFCSGFLLLILFCFGQCKKEPILLNITLYNKPLNEIQSNIQGKWKCHYGKGGIVANMIQYYSDYYWTFSSNNRVQQSNNGLIVTDTTISWVRAPGTYTNGDSTFILSFYDKQNVPWNYVVERIYNDTLIIHDNSSDAVFYHFTKSN